MESRVQALFRLFQYLRHLPLISIEEVKEESKKLSNATTAFLCLGTWNYKEGESKFGLYACIGGHYEEFFKDELPYTYKGLAEYFEISMNEAKLIFGDSGLSLEQREYLINPYLESITRSSV